MLSIGYEVQTHPPEGTQVDWPAILTPRPSDFAKEVTRTRTHTHTLTHIHSRSRSSSSQVAKEALRAFVLDCGRVSGDG